MQDALLAWPERDEWPQIFWQASAQTQEHYRYAAGHRDLLQWMPCFCGCGAQGHDSNFDCYVAEVRDDGSIVIDTMSFG